LREWNVDLEFVEAPFDAAEHLALYVPLLAGAGLDAEFDGDG
jgi:hypothetical protein